MRATVHCGIVLSLVLAASCRHAAADISIDLSWVDTQSTAYQRLKSRADAAVAGNPGYDFKGIDAAYMYGITGQTSYCQLAVNIAEAQVAAAEQAIAAGNRPPIARDSYLYSGREFPDVAVALDWCPDFITAAQRARWKAYGDQLIWNIWNHQDARWGSHSFPWSGWSVDNPGNNYHYSFLTATAFWAFALDQDMGEYIQADGFERQPQYPPTGAPSEANWMRFLVQYKIPALRAYYAALPGGGSREGTAYGVTQRELFAFYRLWKDSTGEDIANASPHLTDSIKYWIHATVPTMDRFAPFGDQIMSGRDRLFDYHRHVILEARRLTSSSTAHGWASWWLHNSILDGTTEPRNRVERPENTRQDILPNGSIGTPPPQLHYRAEGVGQLFARTDWTPNAMWMSFVAGRFDESHAAQEQGTFSLFAGNWLSWTANMYSSTGIVQVTPVNNVLRFERNGQVIPQHRERTAGFTLNQTGANGLIDATADLTPLYDGAISGWQRHIRFENRKLTVKDTWSATSGTTAVFQINTVAQPVINGREATAGNLKVRVVSPADASLSVIDWRTQSLEGASFSGGFRIDVRGSGDQFQVELSEVN